MFLKSLEIKGFKSFADRTELVFEPGVTVVVGPNGSGKSNIVDAVTWVLGAQGPRALRGSKMEDVIFAGGPQRTALGRAQVMLTIDNSTGILPIDFVEVAISRTLYRSGESEYSINGAPCRLLDVQELLSDSGVGRQFHTIVGQGQLDTVLSARPEDRRAVIEEAAGILKFRKRKEKALRRLAATEGNLTRLQDVIRELNRQLKPLERQADAARRYGSVEQRLKDLRWYLVAAEHAALSKSGRERNVLLERTRAELAAEKQRLVGFEAGARKLEDEIGAFRDESDEIAELRQRASELAGGLGSLAEVAAVRAESYRSQAGAPEVLSFDILEAEMSRLQLRIREVDEALPSARSRVAAAVERERIANAEREAASRKYGGGGEAARRVAELTGERNGLESSVARSETEVSRLVERRKRNQDRLERAAAERERLTSEIERLDSEATPLASEVDRIKELRDAARAEVETLDSQRRAAESEASVWAGRLEALRMAAEEQAATEGGRHVLDRGGAGIVGVLRELISVESGFESCVDAALGEALEAIVVTSRDAVDRAVLALKADEAGMAAFIEASDNQYLAPNSASIETPRLGEAEPLLPHVSAREGASGIAFVLRQLLARTYVAGTWSDAWLLSGKYPDAVIVTRSGDRLSGKGLWKAGSGSRGPLRQAASLSEVAASARRASAAVGELEKALDRRRDEAKKAAEALEVLEAALLENDAMLTSAAGQLARVGPEIDDLAKESDSLGSAEAELAERLGRDRDRLAEIDREIESLTRDDEELVSEQEATELLNQCEAALQAAADERSASGIALAQFEERRAVMRMRIDEIGAEIAAIRDAEPVRAEQRQRAAQAELVARSVSERALALEPRVTRLLAAIGAFRESFTNTAQGSRIRLAELRRGAEASRNELARLSDAERRLDLEHAEASVRLAQLAETIRVDFGREPEEAQDAALPEGIDASSASGEAAALEREIRQMGPVNPMALEEFEKLSERIEFVKGQLEDLKSSRRDLQKIVRAVDKRIVEIFEAAFNDVSHHFESIIAKLFPGGKGRLRLTDPENLLETGIDVDARPAGKNVRKLSLLSGGERSMAALGFLFAVFRARPSPFYLLDEVEAALDDLNLHRFLELIEEFRHESQLVLITHQKRSMDVADCLYGVTMQGSGVTKVVSQKMTDPVRI